MTKIIYEKVLENKFTFFGFYLARIKRIVPALACLCSVVLVMGWFYLTPYKYLELGKHVAASMGFISNIVYWREIGYFDPVSHDKWLLHTWSLSVEWQFYIIYPIVLLILCRFMDRKLLTLTLIILSIISICLSQYLSNISQELSFFLLPTRAWEMLLGGVVFLASNKEFKFNRKGIEFIGLGFILLSMILFTSNMLWPSVYTLVPVIGAILVILSERKNNFIFDNSVVTFLGLRSYSIYLWHWPVFVFMNYVGISGLGFLYGILISVLLGSVSFAFIEKGVLFDEVVDVKRFLVSFSFLFVCVLFFSGVYIYFNSGLPDRDIKGWAEVNRSPNAYKCQAESSYGCDSQPNKKPNWAILGNSHAVELSYVLADRLKEKNGIKQFTYAGCDLSYKRNFVSNCRDWNNEVVNNIIENSDIEHVVISFRLSSSLFGDQLFSYPELPDEHPALGLGLSKKDGREKILNSLDSMIADISNSGKHVYVVLPIPELDIDISKKAFRSLVYRDFEPAKGVTLKYYIRRSDLVRNRLEDENFKGVYLIDPKSSFCDKKWCYATSENKALYFDDDHPSLYGASLIADDILSVVND